MSFVADEIRAKQFSPEDAKQLGLFFGEEYEMSLDFEQQFLYGLRVLFAGLLVE